MAAIQSSKSYLPPFGGGGTKESLEAFRTMDQTAAHGPGCLGEPFLRQMPKGTFFMSLPSDRIFLANREAAAAPKGVRRSAHGAQDS